MLPKQYRLPAKEIVDVARRGKRLQGDFFDIRAWYDSTLPHPQFAISISTKVDKRATVRNKIRRKFRAAIMSLFQDNPSWVKPGKYLIIVKKVQLTDNTQGMIKNALISVML